MATLKQRITDLVNTVITKMNALNSKKIDKPTYPSGPDDKMLGVKNGAWEEIIIPQPVSDASGVTYHNPQYPTVENALDELLYVSPSINSFSNNVGTSVLRGTVITSVTFNWTVNKEIVSQSINQGVGAISPSTLRTKTISSQNITSNITYRLTVSDGTNTATRDTTIGFQNYRYWGNLNKTYDQITPTDIQSLNKEINDSKAKTFSYQNNGEYFYYIWRKSAGSINVKLEGLTFTDWVGAGGTIPEISITNSAGGTETYYILQTNNKQNGLMNLIIS